jgi:hypothetical protein
LFGLQTGVVVKSADGSELGVSKKAGMMGVSLSALSRAIWSIPALVIPPLVMGGLKAASPTFARTKVNPKNKEQFSF